MKLLLKLRPIIQQLEYFMVKWVPVKMTTIIGAMKEIGLPLMYVQPFP
jgi:hypothetical protein